MMILLTIHDFYAKTQPKQSIFTHSIISGYLAQCLWKLFLCEGSKKLLQQCLQMSDNQLKSFIGYFVSLHDIGKLSYSFSAQVADEAYLNRLRQHHLIDDIVPQNVKSVRHEFITSKALKKIWEEQAIKEGWFLSSILGAHHQGKNGNQQAQILKEKDWLIYQKQLECEMRQKFLTESIQNLCVQKSDKGVISVLLLGLTILADWIASSESFNDAEQWILTEDAQKRLAEKTTDFLQKSGLYNAAFDFGNSFCEMWPNIQTMRPLQHCVQEVFTGKEKSSMLLIEAPMGEGKTEAGIYAAMKMKNEWGKTGIYFGLPTSATSNQMVGRVREFLKQHECEDTVRLLHAMAWLVDDSTQENSFNTEENEIARNWLAPLRRGLLAQYAVGTVDQAMMAAMMIKYGVLRLLGLSNKVLIVDEIHAFDTFMDEIIICVLQWCRALQIPVVLLSATLPPAKKQKLIGVFTQQKFDAERYPAITAVSETGQVTVYPIKETAQKQTVKVECLPYLHQSERIADFAISLVQEGGCLCILMNTVKQAQEVFRQIPSEIPSLLFHAQFPAEKRDLIEKKCISLFGKDKTNRPEKFILVATQVVEQSLDVDFDCMITAIAPMDLVLQRLGRVFRHKDTVRPRGLQYPQVFVLTQEDNDFQADGVVYPPCILMQTQFLLQQHENICIPEDVQKLVADAYDETKLSERALNEWIEAKIDEQYQTAQANRYILGDPTKGFPPVRHIPIFDDLEQSGFLSAKTRLSEPTVRIALIESDQFKQVQKNSLVIEGKRHVFVSDKVLARLVLMKSVAVREKRLRPYAKEQEILVGRWLLQGVLIFKASNGRYESQDGKKIIFDDLLGLCMEGE